MNYIKLFMLFLIFDIAFSDNICLNDKNPCRCVLPNKTIIDLSPVGLEDKPRFYEILDSNCSEVYSYNPCFPFDSPDKLTTTDPPNRPCTEASACVKGFGRLDGNPPEEHAIGLQSTAVFGMIREEIYINYSIPGSPKKLQVFLNCVNKSSDVHELTVNGPCYTTSNLTVLTLSSKCACPDGCSKTSPRDSPSGLSTGSKLLIAFFTILLAYLIIGIVWNYCNGSQGMELIPNIEFWNDLPTLIMEGVVFTCSCCGRQSSYGEV